MAHYKVKKGLDIPIGGQPDKTVMTANIVTKVGLVADDYPGMKPLFKVAEGDQVGLGQVLFTDKKNESIHYTSPGSGTVSSIFRGKKRKFLSIEIQLEGDAEERFPLISADQLTNKNFEKIKETLVVSGVWTSLKSRPFAKVADPNSKPDAIFVTAMDTRPLAPSPEIIIQDQLEYFNHGLKALSLFAPVLHLGVCPDTRLDIDSTVSGLNIHTFEGKHPVGLVGTHMHYISPSCRGRLNWSIDYQDVIAIGHLFSTGRIMTERTISVAGPSVKSPAYVKTRLGASTDELLSDALIEGEHRIISGSVLYGHQASAEYAYLGRYHNQLTVIPEGGHRPFMGWAAPGVHNYSLKNVFLSRLFGDRNVTLDASLNGSKRPIVPIGSYESVMPFDFETTYLLRALSVGDIERAEQLGALELDEEDLSLCTFVCPGKNDYPPMLRDVLTMIEKEG